MKPTTIEEKAKCLRKTNAILKKENRRLMVKVGILKDERDELKKEVERLKSFAVDEFERGMDFNKDINPWDS
jgi:predicted nuclease with TOPRIM domain